MNPGPIFDVLFRFTIPAYGIITHIVPVTKPSNASWDSGPYIMWLISSRVSFLTPTLSNSYRDSQLVFLNVFLDFGGSHWEVNVAVLDTATASP